MNYEVDKNRYGKYNTGIYVRATLNGRWGSYDVGDLSASSLFDWLRSRGGKNEWAENVVSILLNHDHTEWQAVKTVADMEEAASHGQ